MPARSGRLEKRFQLTIPVEITSLQDPSAIERTTTENVCSLGVRVLFERAKQRNEQLLFRSLAGDLRTQVRVVYCERLTSGLFGVGLQFLGATANWSKDSTSAAYD